MERLNLGCGAFKKHGYLNIDKNPRFEPDIVHDLDCFPYPFEDNRFDLVEADHLLEHLNHPFDAMIEVHRILKHEGELIVRVPHFSRGFTHADHKRGFDASFPYYFKKSFVAGYVGSEYHLESSKLTWFAQPQLKKTIMPRPVFHLLRIIGWILDLPANMAPFFCSRIWCYWVGGFEEIEFRFICIKEE